MSEEIILTDLNDGVFTITLNRPKANAFDTALIKACTAAFKQAAKDKAVRSVLLTGSGKIFSAGQDVTEFSNTIDLSYREHILETYNPLILEIRRLEKPAPIDNLRGIEGEAASSYFAAFPQLITIKEEAFAYTGRNRRPPRDPINALLSFVYTLLVHDCRSALEAVGLDPCVGYLHTDRPGRPSLALDLMEEFRAFLADRLVLSLINRRQIKASDFKGSLGGAVILKDDARKKLLISWQKRKQEEITHPYICEKTKVGLLAHLQALLLARHLRGDIEAYPPFIWK